MWKISLHLMNLASAASLSAFVSFFVKPEEEKIRFSYINNRSDSPDVWRYSFSWAVFPSTSLTKDFFLCWTAMRRMLSTGGTAYVSSQVAFTNRTSWISSNRFRFVRFRLNRQAICFKLLQREGISNNFQPKEQYWFFISRWWRRNFSSENLKSTKRAGDAFSLLIGSALWMSTGKTIENKYRRGDFRSRRSNEMRHRNERERFWGFGMRSIWMGNEHKEHRFMLIEF